MARWVRLSALFILTLFVVYLCEQETANRQQKEIKITKYDVFCRARVLRPRTSGHIRLRTKVKNQQKVDAFQMEKTFCVCVTLTYFNEFNVLKVA